MYTTISADYSQKMRYLDGAGVAPVFDENNKKLIKADHFNSLRYAAALAGLSYWIENKNLA